MPQDSLDEAIDAYYTHQFNEGARLTTRSAQGRLEFERPQQIVRRHTSAPAKILDVGGATGVHAAALADEGYEVTLIDPVPSQVEAARQHETFRALVGDARDLSRFADDTFDATPVGTALSRRPLPHP